MFQVVPAVTADFLAPFQVRDLEQLVELLVGDGGFVVRGEGEVGLLCLAIRVIASD